MADEVGVKTDSTGLSNKSSSLVTSSASSADGEHSKRATPPSVTQGGARDRSMSVGGAELGALRRVASKGALVEDTRAPELLAFEDMTLREHYKVSEKLFEWHELAAYASNDDTYARRLLDDGNGVVVKSHPTGPTDSMGYEASMAGLGKGGASATFPFPTFSHAKTFSLVLPAPESLHTSINVLHVRSEFKLLSKTLSQMSRHMKSFYDQAVVFSELLQKFTFKTDDDDSGDAIMQVCGSQFVRLAQIQLAMSNQMKDVLLTPMEKFIKEELNSDDLKEKCRQVNSKRDSYNAIHRTKEKLEKKKTKDPSKKVDAKKDAKEAKDAQKVATDLATARKEFQASNTTFQKYLSEVHARSRFDFTQRMAAFLYAHKSYYQQGMTVYEYFGEDLLAVMTEMEEARKEFDAHKEEEDHRISIFVSQTQTSGHYKQGYMYKQSHKIKVGKQWSMRWFVMKDGTLSWYSNWKDTSPSGTIHLNLCRVKPILDKPLCLEILQASPEIRLTLRAMTDKDFAAWTSALNGAIAHALTQDPPSAPGSSSGIGSNSGAAGTNASNEDTSGSSSSASNLNPGSPLESLIPPSFAVEMVASGSTPQELAIALLQVHGVAGASSTSPGSAPPSPAMSPHSPQSSAAAQFQAFRKKSASARSARFSASAADLLHSTTATTAITQPSSLAVALSPPQLLAKLREQHTSNQFCADCSAPNPDWVCINNGAIICIDCSGIHRSLGSHVSKVRSLGMDSLKPSVQRFLLDIGNAHLNSILEASISFDPLSASPRSPRRAEETSSSTTITTDSASTVATETSSSKTVNPDEEATPRSQDTASTDATPGDMTERKRKKKKAKHAVDSEDTHTTPEGTTPVSAVTDEEATPSTPHSKSKPPSPISSPNHSSSHLPVPDPSEVIAKPTPSSDRSTRTKFIIAKYVNLKFVIKSDISVEDANKTLVELVHQSPSEIKKKYVSDDGSNEESVSYQQQLSRDLLATHIQCGADLQFQDESTKRSLAHMACEKANVVALSWLVFNGVKGFHQDSQGFYPVHHASLAASIESIQLLYSTPSDVLVKDSQGRTPFELLKGVIVNSALQLQASSPSQTPDKIHSHQSKTSSDSSGKQDGDEISSSELTSSGLGTELPVEGSPSNHADGSSTTLAGTSSTEHSPGEDNAMDTSITASLSSAPATPLNLKSHSLTSSSVTVSPNGAAAAEILVSLSHRETGPDVDGPNDQSQAVSVDIPLLVAQQTTLEFLAVAQVMQLGKEASKASAPSSLPTGTGNVSSPEVSRKESTKSRPGPGVGAQAREEARKRSWTLSGRSKDPLGRVPSRETFTRDGTGGNATASTTGSTPPNTGPVIIGGWSGDSTVANPSAPSASVEGDMEISRPFGASDAKFMSLRMKNKASQRGMSDKFGSISRADFAGSSGDGVSALEAAFTPPTGVSPSPSPTPPSPTMSHGTVHPAVPSLHSSGRSLGGSSLLSASTGSLDDISESRVAIPFSTTLDPLPDSDIAGSESLQSSTFRGANHEEDDGLSSDEEELQNALKTGEAALEALMYGDVIGEGGQSPRSQSGALGSTSAGSNSQASGYSSSSSATTLGEEKKKKEKRSSGGIFRKKDRKDKDKEKKGVGTIAEEPETVATSPDASGQASSPTAASGAATTSSESDSKKDKKDKKEKDKKDKEEKKKEKEKEKESTSTKRSRWSLLRSFSVRETKKESSSSSSSAAQTASEADSVKASRSFWKDLERKSSEEQLERQRLQSSGSSPSLNIAAGSPAASSSANSSSIPVETSGTSSRTRGIQRNNTLAVAGSSSSSSSTSFSPKKSAKASSGEVPGSPVSEEKAAVKKDRSASTIPTKTEETSPSFTDTASSQGSTPVETSSLASVPAWNAKDYQSPVLKKNDTKRFTRANKTGSGTASPAASMPSTPHSTDEGGQ